MDLYKGTVIPASLEEVILGKPNFLFQISTISTFNFNIHTNHSTFHVLKKTFQLATLYDLLEIPDSKVANLWYQTLWPNLWISPRDSANSHSITWFLRQSHLRPQRLGPLNLMGFHWRDLLKNDLPTDSEWNMQMLWEDACSCLKRELNQVHWREFWWWSWGDGRREEWNLTLYLDLSFGWYFNPWSIPWDGSLQGVD